MVIQTNYNIGDEVWFMHDNSAKSDRVIAINVVVEKDMNNIGVHKTITYCLFNHCKHYTEDKLFPTKKELLNSL